MPWPDTLDVFIGWEDSPGGIFVLDGSELDSTDVLAGLGADQFTGTYDNVTTDVSRGPSITIGRDNRLAQFQASSCTFTLNRPGAPDYYNPNAIAGQSPIAGVTPGFEPMRPVRVRATVNAVTTILWYGYIRSAAWDSVTKETTVQADDLFLWLSRVRPTYTAAQAAAAGVTNVATAIGFLLDLSDFTNPDLRDLGEVGKTGIPITLDDNTTGDKTALQLIGDLLTADRGAFWVQGGVATYRARTYVQERDSIATMQSDALRVGSGLDLDRIVNRQRVTRTGGSTQEESDVASQQRYGLADGAAIDTTYLASDTEADELARFILTNTATPQPPITLTLDNDTDTNLERQVVWKVLDRITAPVAFEAFTFGGDDNPSSWPGSLFGGTSGFGGTQDYHIERVEQSWAVNGNHVRTTYTLSRRGAEYARFGFMAFGESDTSLPTAAAFAF